MGIDADLSELPSSHAVKAFIVRGDTVLAVRRGAGDMNYAGQWDLPGGSAEAGETDIDGLKREVWEATGLTIATTPEPFAETVFGYPEKKPVRRMHVSAYLAVADGGEAEKLQPVSDSIDKINWITFADLAETKFIAALRPLIDDFTAQFVAKTDDEVAA